MNAFASVRLTARVVLNLMVTSVLPAVATDGDCSSSELPVDTAWTIPLSPNQTYTGSEVGNWPEIDNQVPPEVLACRGVIASTRQVPSLAPGGAGVVVVGATGVAGPGPEPGGVVDAGGCPGVAGGAGVGAGVAPGVVVAGGVGFVGDAGDVVAVGGCTGCTGCPGRGDVVTGAVVTGVPVPPPLPGMLVLGGDVGNVTVPGAVEGVLVAVPGIVVGAGWPGIAGAVVPGAGATGAVVTGELDGSVV